MKETRCFKQFGLLLVQDVFVLDGETWQLVEFGKAYCPATGRTMRFAYQLVVEFVGSGIWPGVQL